LRPRVVVVGGGGVVVVGRAGVDRARGFVF